MTLSERLAAAARERGEGLPTHAASDRGAKGEAPRVQMILSPSKATTAVTPEQGAAPDSICPTCGRTGELGLVDLHKRLADWSCDSCGSMWRITMPAPADEALLPPVR